MKKRGKFRGRDVEKKGNENTNKRTRRKRETEDSRTHILQIL
jgi:hypothetical protein